MRIAPEAMALLTEYNWRGNVRELENVMERACTLSEGVFITIDHIPAELRGERRRRGGQFPDEIPDSGIELESLLDEMEKNYLVKALNKTGGSKTEASRLLGLTFPSLRHRLKKHGLE